MRVYIPWNMHTLRTLLCFVWGWCWSIVSVFFSKVTMKDMGNRSYILTENHDITTTNHSTKAVCIFHGVYFCDHWSVRGLSRKLIYEVHILGQHLDTMGLTTWWPFLGLLPRYSIIFDVCCFVSMCACKGQQSESYKHEIVLSSSIQLTETCRVPVDGIYWYPIIEWVTGIWMNDWVLVQ